jgi:predicted amidohydrolase YtcJ
MDSIWINGKIWDSLPHVQAIAVSNGHIHAMGTNQEMLALRTGHTLVQDAKGRLILPGFNDSHVHFMEGGFYRLGVDLRNARDEAEFAALLKDKASCLPAGTWITGGYWDHEKWPSRKLPSKELIDKVVPEHPVFVVRLDWHIACANSLALRLAGIDQNTPVPQGGMIDKHPDSRELSGILRDEAERLVTNVIPQPTREQKLQAAQAAMRHAAGLGVTSVQGECLEPDQSIFSELAAEGRLRTRMSIWQPVNNRDDVERLRSLDKVESSFFRSSTAKLFVDGSFGATTALLFEPFNDLPQTCGLAIHEESELKRLITDVDALGWQLAVHAIGDRAVFMALNAFEHAVRQNSEKLRRNRIEHAQMVRDQDLPRFHDLQILASVQPSHCIDDMRWIENRIGDRSRTAYRLNSFLRHRIPVAFGTDWTVEPLDPMLTVYAAITREYLEGGPSGGWHPEECVSLVQAIELYTEGAAFAEFQESHKGRLKAGYVADFLLLPADFLYRSPQAVLNSQVETTVVDGQIVFDRTGLFEKVDHD